MSSTVTDRGDHVIESDFTVQPQLLRWNTYLSELLRLSHLDLGIGSHSLPQIFCSLWWNG